MATIQISTKRLQIELANKRILLVIGVCAFLTVFGLFAAKALFSQYAYQSRVIVQKEKSLGQLKNNANAVTNLVDHYKDFIATEPNLIKGSSTGVGIKDGDNARIILDALPSQYDFPALAVSIQQLIIMNSVKAVSINGIDDQVAQEASKAASTPTPVEMPIQFEIVGPYPSIQLLVKSLQNSIRPIKVSSMAVTADAGNNLDVRITASTYYLPNKSLNIQLKVVK